MPVLERDIPQSHAVDKELREVIIGLHREGWMIPDIAAACEVSQAVVSKVIEVFGGKPPVNVSIRSDRESFETMRSSEPKPRPESDSEEKKAISEGRRRVLEMIVDQKLRPRKIAELLGIREGTVRWHITEAVRRGEIVRVDKGDYAWPDDGGQTAARRAERLAEKPPAPQPDSSADRWRVSVSADKVGRISPPAWEGMEILAPATGVRSDPVLRIREREVRITAALMREFGDHRYVILGIPAPGTMLLFPASPDEPQAWRLTMGSKHPSAVFGGQTLVKRLAKRGFPVGDYLAEVEQGRIIVRAEDKLERITERKAG